MKQSHFQIGSGKLSPLNLKPLVSPNLSPTVAEKFDISEARRRLGEASWNHGQSPTRYETINKASFNQPPGQQDMLAMKKAAFELKSRITGSSVM